MLEVRENKNTRTNPFSIICPNTRHKIINQVIYESFIYKNKFNHLFEEQNDFPWEVKAAKKLSTLGINLTPQTIISYKNKIISGERDPSSASNFSEDGKEIYTSRYGKDGMYKQLKMLVELFIPEEERSYVGLPANQILSITKEYGYKNVVACDNNVIMVDFIKRLQNFFGDPNKKAELFEGDIFDYLSLTDKTFSFFDFDLMCHITSKNLIHNLVSSIIKTSKKRCIVNIATTIGRKIDEATYRTIMPNDFIKEIENEMNVMYHYSDGYNDRIIPMRYETFVLERKLSNVSQSCDSKEEIVKF